MKTIVRNIMAISLVAVMTSSCSMWNNETNGAVLGGIGGTLVGGALGEMLGGHHGSHAVGSYDRNRGRSIGWTRAGSHRGSRTLPSTSAADLYL